MGIDFIRKTAKALDRKFDRALEDLGTPDLFTRPPERRGRIVVAEVLDSEAVAMGEHLLLRKCDDEIVLQRGIKTVARVDAPSELLEAMAVVLVAEAKVCSVLELSGVIEVELR